MTIKNHKRVQRAIRVPAYAEIALGTAPKQTEIVVGKTYELHPACDLWMGGAKSARVKAIYADAIGRIVLVSVAPIVMDTEQRGTHRIAIDHFA